MGLGRSVGGRLVQAVAARGPAGAAGAPGAGAVLDPSTLTISVKAAPYLAKGNGKYVLDAGITSGAAILTSATAGFTNADIGKHVLITGAGTAGTSLHSTITGFTNATTVTLAANASTTVSNGRAVYGTDDTAAIQAWLDALANAKGGVGVVDDGVYIVAGNLRTTATIGGGTYRAQLTLPFFDITTTPKAVLKLLAAKPAGGQPSLNTGIQTYGAIFQSMLVGLDGTGGIPSLLGGPVAQNFGDLNSITNMHIELSGITFRCPSNPSLAGCDLSKVQTAEVHNVRIDTLAPTSGYLGTVFPEQPTHPSGQGLLLPQELCQSGKVTGDLFITGFYAGLRVGEHSTVDYYFSFSNYLAASVTPCFHQGLLKYINAEHCTYVIGYADPLTGIGNVTAATPINVLMADIEDNPSPPNGPTWTNPVNHVNDPTSQIIGTINYRLITANVGVSTVPPVVNGANKVSFYRDGLPLQPQALVWGTAAHTIPNATWTALPWDAAQTNVGALWSAGSPTVLTIPQDGLYLIECSIEFPAAAGGTTRQLRLTGVGFFGGPWAAAQGSASGALNTPLNCSLLRQMNGGDTVVAEGYQDSGGALQWNKEAEVIAHLSIVMLGAGLHPAAGVARF